MTILRRISGILAACSLLGLIMLHGLMACVPEPPGEMGIVTPGHAHVHAVEHVHGASGRAQHHQATAARGESAAGGSFVSAADAADDGSPDLLCLGGIVCTLAMIQMPHPPLPLHVAAAVRDAPRSDWMPNSRGHSPAPPPPRA